MRFGHKISYLILQQSNYTLVFPEDNYLGIKLKMSIERKKRENPHHR